MNRHHSSWGYLAAITLRASAAERNVDLTCMLVLSFVKIINESKDNAISVFTSHFGVKIVSPAIVLCRGQKCSTAPSKIALWYHNDSFCLSPSFFSLSQTKLVLQKQLARNLTASFLHTTLTPPTLSTVAANPLALRHPPGTTFIQMPMLGPALFRPAPGPLRATHTPFIFSPYWSPRNKTNTLLQQDRTFTWFSLTIRSQYWRSLCKLRPCSRALQALYT